jgi:4'-phosphopantetheinyl transferase
VESTDVTVVWLDLDAGRDDVAAMRAVLADDEAIRVDHLATELLRRRATVRLARRRQVLADLLGTGAPDVVISTDQRDRLRAAGGGRTILVSASSSEGMGLLGITDGLHLGVDVEAVGELANERGFIARVATPREAAVLERLDGDERRRCLSRLWTRKEAYLKATGEGITDGVAHVDVPLDDGSFDAAFRPIVGGDEWRLFHLRCPREGFTAALVVEGGPRPWGRIDVHIRYG